jgi:hypothetical protein
MCAVLTLCLLLCAQPVTAQSLLSRATDIALAAHAVGQAADTATTLYGVHTGKARELNPLLHPLVDTPVAFVAVKATVTVAVTVVLRRLKRRHPRLVAAAAVVLAATYTGVVIWNLKELSK